MVLTPAAVVCLILERMEALNRIQEKMDSFYKDPMIVISDEPTSTLKIVSDIVDELIDELPNKDEVSRCFWRSASGRSTCGVTRPRI